LFTNFGLTGKSNISRLHLPVYLGGPMRDKISFKFKIGLLV